VDCSKIPGAIISSNNDETSVWQAGSTTKSPAISVATHHYEEDECREKQARRSRVVVFHSVTLYCSSRSHSVHGNHSLDVVHIET